MRVHLAPMSADESDYPLSPTAPVALVIEDDPDGARIAIDMLRMLGYRSRWSRDANEALYALSEGPPALILLDICLPVMDGVNLIKVARKFKGIDAVPVVGVSAVYPEGGSVTKVLEKEGVPVFLSKPFTMNGLRDALDRARSVAMKFGPPPPPSMSEGMPAVTDADIARATASATASEAGPPAPAPDPTPTPPVAEPAPPTPRPTSSPSARTLTPGPSAQTLPPGATSRATPKRNPFQDRSYTPGRMRGPGDEDSLSFPIKFDTGDHPMPGSSTPGPDKLAATEIVGKVTVDSSSSMIIVEAASRASVTFRSLDLEIAPGSMVRMEVRHRMAVDDSMQEITIRLLGHSSACVETPAGDWKVRARVAAARPSEAYDHLVDFLMRFADY